MIHDPACGVIGISARIGGSFSRRVGVVENGSFDSHGRKVSGWSY